MSDVVGEYSGKENCENKLVSVKRNILFLEDIEAVGEMNVKYTRLQQKLAAIIVQRKARST